MSVRSFLGGLAINTALVGFLASIHVEAPPPRPSRSVAIYAPSPAPPVLKPPPSMTAPPRTPLVPLPSSPQRIELPVLPAPPPVRAIQPQPAPEIIATAPTLPTPPPPVITGTFQTASARSAPKAPIVAVATGAFSSAPSAVPQSIAPVSSAQVGLFAAATSVAAVRSGTEVLHTGGFDATSTASRARPLKPAAPIATNFDTIEPAGPKLRNTVAQVAAGPVFRSVEILSKPKPAYTDEARQLRIEGEVWLEILFAADGAGRVQRVIRSLGHGLDENAIAAARQIRFRPARTASGQPVDQQATIRVQFQLAE